MWTMWFILQIIQLTLTYYENDLNINGNTEKGNTRMKYSTQIIAM